MKHIEATGIHPAAGDIRCVKHVCCEADAAVRTRQFDSVVERRAYGGRAAGFELRKAIRKKKLSTTGREGRRVIAAADPQRQIAKQQEMDERQQQPF